MIFKPEYLPMSYWSLIRDRNIFQFYPRISTLALRKTSRRGSACYHRENGWSEWCRGAQMCIGISRERRSKHIKWRMGLEDTSHYNSVDNYFPRGISSGNFSHRGEYFILAVKPYFWCLTFFIEILYYSIVFIDYIVNIKNTSYIKINYGKQNLIHNTVNI